MLVKRFLIYQNSRPHFAKVRLKAQIIVSEAFWKTSHALAFIYVGLIY